MNDPKGRGVGHVPAIEFFMIGRGGGVRKEDESFDASEYVLYAKLNTSE